MAAEVMLAETTPVASACVSSAACTVTGWAPISSIMRATVGL